MLTDVHNARGSISLSAKIMSMAVIYVANQHIIESESWFDL